MELRISCYSNQIDLHLAVHQQGDLVELAYLDRQLESMPARHAHLDELSVLRR
jgi:hypothetical protein